MVESVGARQNVSSSELLLGDRLDLRPYSRWEAKKKKKAIMITIEIQNLSIQKKGEEGRSHIGINKLEKQAWVPS